MPLPLLSGGESWIYGLAKNLAKTAELHLFSFLEPGFEPHQVAHSVFLEKVFKTVSYRKKEPFPDSKDLPDSPARHFSPGAAERINGIIEKEGIDLAHIFFQDLLFYSAEIKKKLPLVYTEIDSSWLSPFNSYLRENAGARGLGNMRETLKYRAYAKKFLRNFQAVTYLSREDYGDIKGYTKGARALYTPNALELGAYANRGKVKREKNTIFFIGNYLHYPNADAALTLTLKVYPAVKEKVKDARLILAGPFPPEELKKTAGGGIEITDYVKNHLERFEKYALMAAPVRYGRGVKTKVLEAFASGLPVAGYHETFCGLETGPSGNCVLKAGNARELAGKIVDAFRGKYDLEKMAANSRELSRRHDIAEVSRKVLELYLKLCA